MRRVKMLEYALKQERSKYLTMSNQQAQAAATAAAASQAQSASNATPAAQTQSQNVVKEKKDADPKSKLVKEEKQPSGRDSPAPEGASGKDKDKAGNVEAKAESGASSGTLFTALRLGFQLMQICCLSSGSRGVGCCQWSTYQQYEQGF